MKGLRRFTIGLVAAAAASAGTLAAMPLMWNADHVRDAVIAHVRAATGLDPVSRGATSVSLFPSAHVSFADVVLGDDGSGEPALTADELRAQLRLLPLLVGRIEIADIAMVRPRIVITFDRDGESNWSTLLDALARSLRPGAAKTDNLVSFSEIRITDGRLALRDPTRGVSETLTEVALSLAWPSISRSFGATGRVKWREEVIDVSLTLSDLLAAIRGDRSGLKIRLAGAPAKLAFEGHVSKRPGLRVEGTLAADGPSLRKAMQWVGLGPPPGGGFGHFAIKAQANVAGTTVALSRVNVELDGNVAEGGLTLAVEAPRALRGTLAAEEIDLTPYVSTVRLLRGDRTWSEGSIALDEVKGIEVDLRLSAQRVIVGGAKFGRTALAAAARGGQMTVTIGESQAFGGLLKGSASLAAAGPATSLKAQLQFTDVDLDQCLGELFGIRRLEGNGSLSLSVEGTGTSVLALTRTLNGQVSLTANHGALVGLNLEQLLRRLERRPLSAGSEFRTGRTPFQKLTVDLRMADGIATVQDVSLEASAVRVELGGIASIPSRDLNLKGVASLLAPGGGPTAPPFELPFVVQGRWDDPVMLPDPQTLIRRSGAAIPLLEALKDRQARESLRSTIEQLMRGGASPTANAPSAEPEPTPQ
jgi:AsmA protein